MEPGAKVIKITSIYDWAQPSVMYHSSLLVPFVSYEENEVL